MLCENSSVPLESGVQSNVGAVPSPLQEHTRMPILLREKSLRHRPRVGELLMLVPGHSQSNRYSRLFTPSGFT
jgi:hypothetical protein